jgi:hypothetical protein
LARAAYGRNSVGKRLTKDKDRTHFGSHIPSTHHSNRRKSSPRLVDVGSNTTGNALRDVDDDNALLRRLLERIKQLRSTRCIAGTVGLEDDAPYTAWSEECSNGGGSDSGEDSESGDVGGESLVCSERPGTRAKDG